MTNIHHLDWPAPNNVRACYTLRIGGHSPKPYNSFNLAEHVGDTPEHVQANREQLAAMIEQVPIAWLQQVHGTEVVLADTTVVTADANVTRQQKLACCVLTADCLPVFFCDRHGEQVAVAHAGWRGLAKGILQQTLATFSKPSEVMVYLGPAISQQAFEVGEDVRQAFLNVPSATNLTLSRHFVASKKTGKYLADLYGLAHSVLQSQGVEAIYGGDRCTFSESECFFSYRRDGQTGRMANVIWKL